MRKLNLFVLCITLSFSAFAVQQNTYDRYPWAVTYYYGITGSDALIRIVEGNFHRWPEHIQSLELGYTLRKTNVIRQVVQPLLSSVQIALNFTQRNDKSHHYIYEIDPYIAARWENFPWDEYVKTSFAVGEGISYASAVPSLEKKCNDDTKRLLNYLMLEATFALPQHPNLELIARIHHRSGAYGLYHAGNTGSNVVGLGIRYLFD